MEACSRAKKILRTFPRDVQKFFQEIDKKCQKHGYKFKIGSGANFNYYGRCGGYFCDKQKILAVAIGSKNLERILSLLLHESSHFEQSLDKKSIWYNYKINSGHERFFLFLGGKRIYKKKSAALAAVLLEADCERRAFKKAKKWSKYLNLERYAAKANAYILSYHWMLEHGQWLKKSPYDRKIIAHSPKKLLRSYNKVPPKLKLAFEKYL